MLPYVREGLDILFVGLNPAKKSYDKKHYFSKNCAFWDQLYESGLITSPIDKDIADERVFGSTEINANQWEYGVTDLVSDVAESNSRAVKPTDDDCVTLEKIIKENKLKIVVILHSKVIKIFCKRYSDKLDTTSKCGYLGTLIKGCDSIFFKVPFPHGNSIPKYEKVKLYKQIKNKLETLHLSVNN